VSDDILTFRQGKVRGTDSNTLLRMYDAAKERCARPASLLERDQARRAIERIGAELRKREVRV